MPNRFSSINFITTCVIAISLGLGAAIAAPGKEAAKAKPVVKDYGVQGHLFKVIEISPIEEIQSILQAAKKNGTLGRLQEAFKEKVKKKIMRPNPVSGIVKATEDRSWIQNPTYTQSTEITDGRGNVIVAAGTSVNALDKMNWGEPFIFIDGDDETQVNWAKKKRGRIILTNGAPLELGTKLNRPIYFDQGGILTSRFWIKAVPAVVEQEHRSLRITEVAL